MGWTLPDFLLMQSEVKVPFIPQNPMDYENCADKSGTGLHCSESTVQEFDCLCMKLESQNYDQVFCSTKRGGMEFRHLFM